MAYALSAIPAIGVVGIWWSVPTGRCAKCPDHRRRSLATQVRSASKAPLGQNS